MLSPNEFLTAQEQSRQENLQNLLHQTDNALRKVVSEKIQQYQHANSKEQIKAYSQTLQATKRTLLAEIKNKMLLHPVELDIDSAVQVIVQQFQETV